MNKKITMFIFYKNMDMYNRRRKNMDTKMQHVHFCYKYGHIKACI